MENNIVIFKSDDKRKKEERRKRRVANKARKKAIKNAEIKASKKKKQIRKTLEQERQMVMDRQYAIASMNNDHKTMRMLLENGYKPKGRSGSGRGRYDCSNPKPYQGGTFSSK